MSESTGSDNKNFFNIRRAITVNAPRNLALALALPNIRHAANPDRAQAKPQILEASEVLPLQQPPHIEGMCNHGGPFNGGLTQETLALFKEKALSDQADYNATHSTQGEQPVHMERILPAVEVVRVSNLDQLQNIFYEETLDTNGFNMLSLLQASPLELKNRRNQIAEKMNLNDGQMTISYVLTESVYNHLLQSLPGLNVKSVAEYFTAHAYVGNKMLSDANLSNQQIVRKIFVLPDNEMTDIAARPLRAEDPNAADLISNWRQYSVTDSSGNTRPLLMSGMDHQLVGFPYKKDATNFYPYTSSYLVDIFVPELGKIVKIDIGAIHEWVYHQTFYNCTDEYRGSGNANVASPSEQNPFLKLHDIFNMHNSIGSNLGDAHSGIIPIDAEIARLFSQIHPDWRGYMPDFTRDYMLPNQKGGDPIRSVTDVWPYAINLSVASRDGSISMRDSGTNKVSAFFIITNMTGNPPATSRRVDSLYNYHPDDGIFNIQPDSLAQNAGAEDLYNPNNGSFNVRHIGIQIGESGVVIPIPSEAVNMATFCSRYTENGSINPNFNNVLKWTLKLYKDFDTIQLPPKHSMYIYNLPFEPDEDDGKSSSIYASMQLGMANYLIWSINALDISGLTPKQTFKEYIPVANTQIQ